jgi:two-component system, OmpR family, sensor histidine kinase KdpD
VRIPPGVRVLGAVVAPVVVALALRPFRDDLNHTIVVFALLVPVGAVAWVGGMAAGITAAVVGAACFNYLFLPPYGTFDLERPEYVVVFVGFLTIATAVSALVGRARDRAAAAEAREAEVRLLFDLSRELALAPERPEGLAPTVARAGERLGFVTARIFDPGEHPSEAGALIVPLRVGDDDLGTMGLIGDRSPLTDSEERVLRTFADQLALALQTDRLERTLREAEVHRRTDGLRRALLAAASHELKSPIAAITTAVTDVLDQGGDIDPAYVTEVLEDVRASTGRLEQLVTNLLDMSRIEAGTLVARDEAVDLADRAEAAAGAVARRWPGADVRTDVSDDAVFVRGDPVFVERILTNLLENAVRASRDSANPSVEVAARRHGKQVVVAVRDHGPGLGDSDRALLFTPFYRLEERSPWLGAGLGLAICKGFATAMGGTIAATETPGGGTSIVVRLPSLERV